MTVLDDPQFHEFSEEANPTLRLTPAVRAFLLDPSEEHRERVVRAMVGPLRIDAPETVGLEKILREVLSVEHVDIDFEATLSTIGWYERQLQPSGNLRIVAEDWPEDDDGDPGPIPPGGSARPGVDEYAEAVAWQVRRLRINDEARTIYNAERSATSIPEALDVAGVIRGDHAPLLATMLTRTDGVSLIYPGLLHWAYSPPGIGKTMLAVHASAQLVNAGGHVGYLDWEGNPLVVGDRMKGSVSADVAAERFHYYRPGNLEMLRGWLEERAQEWHLCIFDGTAKALAASGRDEERNPDVLAWMEAVITPLIDAGVAVLMLDHVTKDPESRGMPRGAGAKQGEVSGAAWEIRAGQPFNRRRSGFLKLIQRKDREGRTGIDGDPVGELHVLSGRNGTRLELRAPAASAVEQARMVRMEHIWNTVHNVEQAGMATSVNKIRDIAGGDKQGLADLLAELVDLGHLRVNRGGSGRANTYQTVSPYRAPAIDPPPPLPKPAPTLGEVPEWNVLEGE